MSHRSYRWLFWLLALVGFTVDQVSKYGIFTWLQEDDHREAKIEVIPDYFDIVTNYTTEPAVTDSILSSLRSISADRLPVVNKGALFGTTLQFAPGLANVVFAIVSILAASGITYWSTRASAKVDWRLCCALGFILGGTLGNLFDRVVFDGVRDFISWHWRDVYYWPVFNIADSCLVCGAGLLVVEAFFAHAEPTPRPAEVGAISSANSMNL